MTSQELQEKLAVNLVRRLSPEIRAPEYSYSWKECEMPNRWLPVLRASGRRTSDSAFTGWPTPIVDDANNATRATGFSSSLTRVALLAGWPTPRVTTNGGHGNPKRGMDPNNCRLEDTAQIAGWSTPASRDYKDTAGMSTTGTNPDGSLRSRLDQLPRQAATVISGETGDLSIAQTEKRGALNPQFSLWLMGFPQEWLSSEVLETLSCRPWPRNSSKHSSKLK